MSEAYSDTQIDTILNLFFRDHIKPTPWKDVGQAIGEDMTVKELYRVIWGRVTGYNGHDARGPRLVYKRTILREDRTGRLWHRREIDAMKAALEGAGRLRQPPCDVVYIAAVLARPEKEVAEMWALFSRDELDREGLGFA